MPDAASEEDMKPPKPTPIPSKAFQQKNSAQTNFKSAADSFRISSSAMKMLIKHPIIRLKRLQESEIRIWTQVIKISLEDEADENGMCKFVLFISSI